MIPVSNEIKRLLHSDYSNKTLYLEFKYEDIIKKKQEDGNTSADSNSANSGQTNNGSTSADPTEKPTYRLSAEQILAETLEIDESLCTGSQLHFGACEASTAKIDILNFTKDTLLGYVMYVHLYFIDIEEDFLLGKYLVVSDELSSDHQTRTIEGYDLLYFFNLVDVTEWYNKLEFPLTVRQFRDSLMEELTLDHEETTLINDRIILPDFTLPSDETISAGAVLQAICSINAVFGHMSRDGKFVFKQLNDKDTPESLYPGSATFPGSNTYPGDSKLNGIELNAEFIKEGATWQTYSCLPITILDLRNSYGGTVYIYKSDKAKRQEDLKPEEVDETALNIYTLSSFLLDNLDEESLKTISENFYNSVKTIEYVPANLEALGDPSLEVGDAIIFYGDDGTSEKYHKTFILSRHLSGVQDLWDEYTAEGSQYYEWNIPAGDSAMQAQIANLNALTQDLNNRLSGLESGESFKIVSVEAVPANPTTGVLYLVQGRVRVDYDTTTPG